jgi:hypothetical protein
MRYGGRDDGLSPGFGGISPSYVTEMDDRTRELQALYRQAFRDFGGIALWNFRPAQAPTAADALAITKALRTHGTMDGRRLAERIEELCRADR